MIGRDLLKTKYTQADIDCAIEQARIEERQRIGAWLDYLFLIHGHYLKDRIEELKRGELPEGA